jgi:hypothetical protein
VSKPPDEIPEACSEINNVAVNEYADDDGEECRAYNLGEIAVRLEDRREEVTGQEEDCNECKNEDSCGENDLSPEEGAATGSGNLEHIWNLGHLTRVRKPTLLST